MINSSVLTAPLPIPLPARPSRGEGEQPCNAGSVKKPPTLRTSAVAQPTSLPPRKQPMLLLYCNSRIQSTNNAAAKTLTYDLNGNLISAVTSTSTNTYEWDAADSDQPWNQSI